MGKKAQKKRLNKQLAKRGVQLVQEPPRNQIRYNPLSIAIHRILMQKTR